MLKLLKSPFLRATGAASLAFAGALLASSASAVETGGGTTVFTAPDGTAWTVVVRPAVRSTATVQTITVPSLSDPLDPLPAVQGTVAQALPEEAGPPPAAPDLDPQPQLPTPSAIENPVDVGVTVTPAPARTLNVLGRRYEDAYRSIPYNQLEYRANPGYRHEAAMELLFGELRPTTVVRQSAPQPVESPRIPLYRPYPMTPSEYWSYPQSLWPFLGSQYFGSPTGCVWP